MSDQRHKIYLASHPEHAHLYELGERERIAMMHECYGSEAQRMAQIRWVCRKAGYIDPGVDRQTLRPRKVSRKRQPSSPYVPVVIIAE